MMTSLDDNSNWMAVFSGFQEGGVSVTLPLDKTFDDSDVARLSIEVRRMYQTFSRQISGIAEDFTPVAKGASAAGVGTYSIQRGIYILQGLMVDVYFDIQWSAHTGTGNLYIELPHVSQFTDISYPGTVLNITGGLNYTAGYTESKLRVGSNSRKCFVLEDGDAVATQSLAVMAAARIIGHARYPIQGE